MAVMGERTSPGAANEQQRSPSAVSGVRSSFCGAPNTLMGHQSGPDVGTKRSAQQGLCVTFWFPDKDLLELTMRSSNLFLSALGVERAVMQDCVFEPQPSDQLATVVRVRPTQKKQSRCAVCGHRCQGYDRRDGVPRWRAVELGMYMTLVDAEAPHVRCYYRAP